jgi:DNA-binding transcriptional LysR family regulator
VFAVKWLVADDLAAGRLEISFELELPLSPTFYLVYPEAYSARRKVIIFQDWFLWETVLEDVSTTATASGP